MDDLNKRIIFQLAIANVNNVINQLSQVDQAFRNIGRNSPKLKDAQKEIGELAKSYTSHIAQMTKQAEGLYQTWKKTGSQEAKNQLDALIPSIRQASSEYSGFRRELGLVQHGAMSLGDSFQYAGAKFRSHLTWLATGGLISGMVGLPLAIANVTKEIEQLNSKLKQNLELAPAFHGNNKLLEQGMKQLNNIAAIYSIGYGEKLEKILSSMIVVARRFKDINEISAITSSALTLSKIDNIPLEMATANLESIMLQFQMTGKELRQFTNDVTVVAHIAKITGQEVFEALARSGSAFSSFNINSREAIAMIAAMATETGKTASTIGQSWKSILANLSLDKAIEALDAYGIKLYDVNEQGLKSMRKGVNIFAELRDAYAQMDDEARQKLAYRISGGKFQIQNMFAFLSDTANTFENILEEINSKSSDAMTASLLKLGLETWAIKLMQLEASLQVFGKTIGNEVLPNLKAMTDGLTTGVMWLTDHKEAVSTTIASLVELAKVIMVYQLQQMLANAAIREGTMLLRIMYLLEGNFTTAFYGMTTALKTFGTTAATLTLQLAALYTAINVVQAAYERFSDKSGLTAQQQDISNQLASVEGNRQFALANRARTGMSDDEVNQIYDSQKNELTAKLEAINNAKKETENVGFKKAQDESERAFQAMLDKQMGEFQKRQMEISNQIPDKKHTGSTGAKYVPDKEDSLFRLDKTREVNHMFKQAIIDADNYAVSMDKVNSKQEIFGLLAETSEQRINLMKQRIVDLMGKAIEYTDIANIYEQQANDIIANNDKIKIALDEQKISWSELSKEEKKAFTEKYKDYVEDYKLLTKLLELTDELRVKASDASKEGNQLGAKTIKAQFDDAKTLYSDKIREYGLDEQHEIYGLGRYATQQQKDIISLKYAVRDLALAQQELNRIEKEYGSNSELYKAQQVEVDKLKEKVDELGDTWQTVRNQFSDMVTQLVTEGQSFSNIWRNLWNGLANDAIKALFRVQNTTPSILSSILGIFGGGTTGANTSGTKPHTGGIIGVSSIPSFHNGGLQKFHNGGTSVTSVFPDETVALLRKNEEVNTMGERRSIEFAHQSMNAMMEFMQNFMDNQGSQTNSQPIIINAVDSQSFVELMAKHGEAIAAILRRQGALNNGNFR